MSLTHRTARRLPLVLVLVLVLSGGLGGRATARAEDGDPTGVWPLSPEPDVVRHFEAPPSPYAAGHRGVDLGGASGQRVLAALPGTVTYAGVLAGRGVVVVSHGATRTTYQPVTAGVDVGDAVGAGDPLGRLVVAGSHCLPRACLHWGWIEGETYLDPLRLVGAAPVRLLPLWTTLPGVTSSVAPTALPYAAWRPLLDVVGAF